MFGGWFLLCCLVSLTFRHHWNEKWKRETMAPVPGVYMPLTRAQRDAVEGLAERSDSGAYVRNMPNDTIELLKVERGAVHRYIVGRTRGPDARRVAPEHLAICVLALADLGRMARRHPRRHRRGLVQEEVVSFPLIAEDKVKTAAAVLFLTALAPCRCGTTLARPRELHRPGRVGTYRIPRGLESHRPNPANRRDFIDRSPWLRFRRGSSSTSE